MYRQEGRALETLSVDMKWGLKPSNLANRQFVEPPPSLNATIRECDDASIPECDDA
jgi:hypothetical protein